MIACRLQVASRWCTRNSTFTGRMMNRVRSAPTRQPALLPACSTRFYSATSLLQFPERRRRRRSGGVDDESRQDVTTEKPKPKIQYTDAEFQTMAMSQLDKLHESLQPVLPINPDLTVTRGFSDEEEEVSGPFLLIDAGPKIGSYNIQVDNERQCITMRSPMSGQFDYVFIKEGWHCDPDGHDMNGMFVRDLIRHIQGVPKL